MYKVEISDCGHDQTLECARREALNDTCSKQVLVVNLGFTNRSADNIEQSGDEENRSFAVFAAEGRDEGTNAAGREQVVAGDHNDNVDVHAESLGHAEVGGIKEWALRRRLTNQIYQVTAEVTNICSSVKHGSKRENGDDDFLPPFRPVQWIIRVFTGLRA